jgi:hypothetical protein
MMPAAAVLARIPVPAALIVEVVAVAIVVEAAAVVPINTHSPKIGSPISYLNYPFTAR